MGSEISAWRLELPSSVGAPVHNRWLLLHRLISARVIWVCMANRHLSSPVVTLYHLSVPCKASN